MDFEQVLRSVLEGFEREHVRYAAIGGFAMGALGVPRATMDLDFLIHHEDLERVRKMFGTLGFGRLAHMENVSHYVHRDSHWGRIDILHAFRTYSLKMLERARPYPIFDRRYMINVLEAEDVIGLKAQAMANNPERRKKEEVDIETLMARFGRALDWSRVQEYYDLFELGEEARTLRARFGRAQ